MKPLKKKMLYGVLTLFGMLTTMVVLAFAGCRGALYPLARAFGFPPESELTLCRAAFEQFRSRLDSSRVRVAPVYFVPELGHFSPQWRSDLARSLIGEAKARTPAQFSLAPAAPEVEPTIFGHNQMRYLWERAPAYSRWLKTASTDADYIWCVEVFGVSNRVGAIQVYVFDAKGQVAYCRLFNSHHFGDNLPLGGEEPIRLVIKTLFEDLRRDSKTVFPPYGVG